MDTLPVTLIVKAPNHAEKQDHTVQCELSWTISRLKGHLSEVYPCKPEEQKLIYSGQLLQDAVVLKDVLRQYEGQETHTVHLVYTPKQQLQQMNRNSMDHNKESSSSSSSSSSPSGPGNMSSGGDSAGVDTRDGLRRRHVGSTTQSTTTTTAAASSSSQGSSSVPNHSQQQQLPMNLQALYSQPFSTNPIMFTTPTAPPPMVGGGGAATSEQISAYQLWYQQHYLQYVNQYMAYMTTLQQQQQMMHPQQGMMMPGAGGIIPSVGSPPIPAADAAPVDPQQQLAQQQPRFPMMVHEPDRPERDWLDHVNTICRISFLLLMIYFYSSALRFAIVMCAIFAVFFYRNRRALMRLDRTVPVPAPAPPVNPVAAAAVPGEAGIENVAEEAVVAGEGAPLLPGNGNPDNNNNVDLANRNAAAAAAAAAGGAGTAEEQNNAPTTVLSFLRTFVTSFFYSLLPEPAMAP